MLDMVLIMQNRVRELLSDTEWTWRIGRNYVKLDPGKSHVLKVLR